MKIIIGMVLWGLAGLLLSASAGAVTTSFTVSGTWTAPAGVTSVTVEAWGAGGGGGAATGNPAKGGGGAGGQYAKKVVAVVPGTVYAIAVGAGGTVGTAVAGGIGGNSTFAATTVVAKGGAGGALAAANNSCAAAGAGSATGGVGDLVFAGGNGSACTVITTPAGGAGGGGAGSAGAGGNAVGNTAGAGTATGGGAGGAGLTARGAGNVGVVAGGGGGGGYATSTTDRSGGLGAAGAVNISYVSSGPVAVTYYHDTTTGVAIGFDGPTNVTSGTNQVIPPIITASLTTANTCTGNARSNNHPAGLFTHSRWYLTTNYAVATNISANPSGVAIIRGVATTDSTIVSLYDYDPVTGVKTLIGSSPVIVLTNGASTSAYPYTISSPLYTVPAGHRLMLEYSFNQLAATNNARVYCFVNPANYSYIAVTETAAAAPMVCVTDTFTGADNAAPGANWSASSNSGTFGAPKIFNTAGNGRLRLTDATANVATLAVLQRQFPGAGNKIVVDFDHFAYGGNGADGIAVVLSDAAVLPAPGSYGGSLGYANRSTPAVVDGFAGGWLGVGIDEYGNFSNPIEGRSGGPGLMLDSVSVRGSGSAQTGYAFHTGTATLNPQVDNNGAAAPSHRYRITIDHTNGVNAWVTVERNTGAGYVLLIPAYDAKIKAGQAAVPANWLLSFSGSTGASTNIHEIDNLSVCTTQPIDPYIPPPAAPGDFNTFDSTTASGALDGVIQTKIAGMPFTLDIAALNTAKTAYLTTLAGAVKVELLNSSDNAGVLDANSCRSTWSLLQALPNATFPAAPNTGRLTLAAITVPDAWTDVRVRVSYPATGTPTKVGCSTDNFAIRPNSFTNPVLSDMDWTTAGTTRTLNNIGASGGVTHKAGQPFTVGASAVNAAATPATTTNYAGMPTPLLTACAGSACTAIFGTFSIGTGTAVAGLINSSTATYNDVGSFALQLQDQTFANVDAADGSTTAQRYISSAVINVGRFVPDHFYVTPGAFDNRADWCDQGLLVAPPNTVCVSPAFTYMGEPMKANFTLTAQNAGNISTPNYTGVLAKLNPIATNSTLVFGAMDGLAPSNLTARLDTSLVTTGSGGFINGSANISVPIGITRGVAADGPYAALDVGIAPVDSDGVTTIFDLDINNDTVNDHTQVNSTGGEVRYGRLKISNAYGSELLPLALPVTVEYWNGTAYTMNVNDDISVVVATLGNYQFNLNPGETSLTNPTIFHGLGNAGLSAPGAGNNGSVDVTVNSSIYLPGNTARATFGVYVGNSVFIYRGRHGR
ncbi:MAG: hypothetical protein Q7T38_01155 [Gallionella sp.]|nr:hypothetical protein [Gallionella sp.]